MHWNTKRHLISFFLTLIIAGAVFFAFQNFHVNLPAIQENFQTRIFLLQENIDLAEEKKFLPKTESSAAKNEISEEKIIKSEVKPEISVQNKEKLNVPKIQDNSQSEKNKDFFEKTLEREEKGEIANFNQGENLQLNSKNDEKDLDQQKIESYKRYVIKKIAGNKIYPPKSRMAGETGSVRIALTVFDEGKKYSCVLLNPCNFEALNQAAQKAVEKSAPFKKLPPETQEIKIIYTMNFTLD